MLAYQACLGVSGHLVGPAAFKAVEASFARRLVGSIPIHSRSPQANRASKAGGLLLTFHLLKSEGS